MEHRRNRWEHRLVVAILIVLGSRTVRGGEPATGQSSLPAVRSVDHNFTIRVGDLERRYTVHVPPGFEGQKAVPAVIMLHGGGGTGRAAATETGWDEKADQAVFLAVFPEALARDPAKPSSFAANPQVVYITVEEFGHTWAGGKSLLPEFMVGKRSDKLKATDVIWEFFHKHPNSAQSKGTP
jgi:poly(3-hydroxybutyrate) depolymerase